MIRISTGSKCVAQKFAAKREKIIQFNSGSGSGGLISFTEDDQGNVTVELYRLTTDVKVVLPDDWPGWQG